MDLHGLFAIPLRRAPEKAALRFPDGRKIGDRETVLSYRELFSEADRLAAGFAARGLRQGDRVAFFLGNRPEFVIAWLAVIRLGAVLVPINLAYRRREIAHMLADAEPRFLLTERDGLAVLGRAGGGREGERRDRPRRGSGGLGRRSGDLRLSRSSTATISRCSSTPRARRGAARGR